MTDSRQQTYPRIISHDGWFILTCFVLIALSVGVWWFAFYSPMARASASRAVTVTDESARGGAR